MTRKVITSEFVIPTVLAIALGIMISTDAIHFNGKYAVPIEQMDANHFVASSRGIAALPNPEVQLSRVRLLLSSMKYGVPPPRVAIRPRLSAFIRGGSPLL
jgi:hypothetical protein